MNPLTTKTAIRVDKITLAPLDPVPVKVHHRLYFTLAMEMFGKARADGRRLSKAMRDEVLGRLKEIRARYLGNKAWDTTLVYAVDNAYEKTRIGKNNLYEYHSQTEDAFYVFRL